MNKLKNAKRNIYTGLIYKAISLFLPFIVRTVMIKEFGVEFLGIDSLFASILQVLNLSELGLSAAVVCSMYKPIAENDIDEINSIYAFIRKSYKIIGIIVLVVGILILPFLKHLIKDEVPMGLNIYLLYIIYLANLVLSYLLFSYKNAVLNAYQRVDISNNILTISKICLYILQLCVLGYFHNYYMYVLALPVSTILNNLLTAIYSNKLFPFLKPRGTLAESKRIEIKKQVAGIFVGKICVVSRNSFDSIIISAFLGLSATAIYNNYYYVMNAIISIMKIITNAITAGIGNSVALYDKNKNYSDFLKFNFLYVWIGSWFTCCLFCLYQPFMKWWIGEELLLSTFSVVLFSVYFFAIIIGDIKATYIAAIGLYWENRYRAIVEAVLNLTLNIILGKIWGINGVLIATIITIIIVNYLGSCHVLFKNYFNSEKMFSFVIKTLKYWIVTGVNCYLCYSILEHFDMYSIKGLIIYMCTLVIIPNMSIILFFSRSREFSLAYNWLRSSFLIIK